MRAASISYRVADFLRRHPPFEWMEERELVDLAGTGRVRFHEAHETLHDAGEERQSVFAVIQQGTVELRDETNELRDLLGPGDIVGIGSSARHRYSAQTASDVLLYVFPQDALSPLLETHSRAQRYLETVFSLAGEDRVGSLASLGASSLWLDAPLPADVVGPEARCVEDEPIRAVAQRMSEHGLSVVAVVDGAGRLRGLVGDPEFRARVATGEVSPDDRIDSLVERDGVVPAPLGKGLATGQYWKHMLRGGTSWLPIADGPDSKGGVLTEGDLALQVGQDPLAPILRIGRARALPEIRRLRGVAATAIEALLADRNAARWAVEAAGALDAATCRRIVARAEADLRVTPDETERCWLLLGAAGRRERFGAMPLGLGLVWVGPEDRRAQMSRLADRVGAELAAVGVDLAMHMLPTSGGVPTQGTLDEWLQAYQGWVHDPIATRMYESLGFFDTLRVVGSPRLEEEIRRNLLDAVAKDEDFLPLLANDSMAHLPPRTFFRGHVVDSEGAQTELLHLENCAVRPLTDLARVFVLEEGIDRDRDTAARLRAFAAVVPIQEDLFLRAADATELALVQRARAAYASTEDRPEIRPESLLKVDRELLKSCFRTILELLEHTAEHFGFPAPR